MRRDKVPGNAWENEGFGAGWTRFVADGDTQSVNPATERVTQGRNQVEPSWLADSQ